MVLQRTAIRSAGPLGVEVACSRGRPRRSSRLLLLGSLDQLALLEGAQGAGERDQLRPVDRPPALLGGLEELRRLRRESPAPAMRGLILLGSRPRRGESTSPRRSRRRRDRSAPPATRAPGTSTTSPSGPAPTTTAPSPFPQRPRRRGRSPAPRAQPQPRSVRTPRPPRGGDAGLVAYMERSAVAFQHARTSGRSNQNSGRALSGRRACSSRSTEPPRGETLAGGAGAGPTDEHALLLADKL